MVLYGCLNFFVFGTRGIRQHFAKCCVTQDYNVINMSVKISLQMYYVLGLPGLEPCRRSGGKKDHGGRQPCPHVENQEGGCVLGLSAHLIHQ